MYLGRAIDLKYQYLVDSAFCAANVHLDVNSQVRCASSSPSSTCSLRALVEPNLLLRRPHFVSENLIFGRSKEATCICNFRVPQFRLQEAIRGYGFAPATSSALQG